MSTPLAYIIFFTHDLQRMSSVPPTCSSTAFPNEPTSHKWPPPMAAQNQIQCGDQCPVRSSPVAGRTDGHHGVSFRAFPTGIAVSSPVHVICGRTGCNPFLDCHFTIQCIFVNSVFHCSGGSSEAELAWRALGATPLFSRFTSTSFTM